MREDYRLFDEVHELLKKIRPWTSADFYREEVVPLMTKIKERLAHMDSEVFLSKHTNISRKKINQNIESDTVPLHLLDKTTNFGIFKNLEGENCNKDPRAPHKYLDELSKSLGRYVCQCEFWSP